MMLEDSHADVVLTHSRLADSVQGVRDVVALDTFGARHTGRVEVPGLTSANLAYVIFTSGSTGRPKGVMIEHRNVANFFTAMDEVLGTKPGVWLATTSISGIALEAVVACQQRLDLVFVLFRLERTRRIN